MLPCATVIILLCANYVCAFNVLVIFSLPLRSHYMAVKPLFDELANKGHDVTVVNSFPDQNAPENLRYITLQDDKSTSKYIFPLSFYEDMDSRFLHIYNLYRHISQCPGIVKGDCEILLQNEKLKPLKTKKYDVIFVEQFMSDCGLVYAAAHYDAPIIGIMSHVMLPWHYSALGLPFNHASDRFYFSNTQRNPPLIKQLENVFLDYFFNTIGKWWIRKNIYDVFSNEMPDYKFDIDAIAGDRMKMLFSNQHFSLTGARVLAPQLLEIGGIHVGKAKSLPEDISEFINKSKHGVIYFSLGSMLHSSSMSNSKLKVFKNVFDKIPQNILWKWENDSIPINSEKILTSSWFPQLDVLCHPKVVGFISHGGMLGTTEAAHCGVPMLVIPFFGDQFSNAAAVEESGLGRALYYSDIDKNNLLDALSHITSNKVQQKAEFISKLWRDRPMSAMDSAIYWTEYVARHAMSPPSLPTKHSSWFQSQLLDGSLILILLSIIFLSYIIINLFITCIISLKNIVLCKNKYKKD